MVEFFSKFVWNGFMEDVFIIFEVVFDSVFRVLVDFNVLLSILRFLGS